MNEASLTQGFQYKLKLDGWKVFKHCDNYTVGIPDSSIHKNHFTIWLEFKALKVMSWIPELDWNRVVKPDRMVQLLNMVELEEKSIAWYILFVICNRTYLTYYEFPHNVLQSVRTKKEFPLRPYDPSVLAAWR